MRTIEGIWGGRFSPTLESEDIEYGGGMTDKGRREIETSGSRLW